MDILSFFYPKDKTCLLEVRDMAQKQCLQLRQCLVIPYQWQNKHKLYHLIKIEVIHLQSHQYYLSPLPLYMKKGDLLKMHLNTVWDAVFSYFYSFHYFLASAFAILAPHLFMDTKCTSEIQAEEWFYIWSPYSLKMLLVKHQCRCSGLLKLYALHKRWK